MSGHRGVRDGAGRGHGRKLLPKADDGHASVASVREPVARGAEQSARGEPTETGREHDLGATVTGHLLGFGKRRRSAARANACAAGGSRSRTGSSMSLLDEACLRRPALPILHPVRCGSEGGACRTSRKSLGAVRRRVGRRRCANVDHRQRPGVLDVHPGARGRGGSTPGEAVREGCPGGRETRNGEVLKLRGDEAFAVLEQTDRPCAPRSRSRRRLGRRQSSTRRSLCPSASASTVSHPGRRRIPGQCAQHGGAAVLKAATGRPGDHQRRRQGGAEPRSDLPRPSSRGSTDRSSCSRRGSPVPRAERPEREPVIGRRCR